MKKFMIVLSLVAVTGSSWAQNLVPNGSFEQYALCPFESNLLGGNVQGWYSIQSSPDYFNVCAEGTPQGYGVPLNIFDYQWPSHGDGYAGVLTFEQGVPHLREIIYTQLSTPLQIGVPVYLSMKVAPGGQGDYPGPVGWVNKGIGLLLTTQPFQWELGTPFPNTAHLYASEILTDTLNWKILSSTYVPDSAYQFATIANFFDDSLSTPVAVDNSGFEFAYAFVDEVCVSLSPEGCGWADGLVESERPFQLMATTPFADRLIVRFERAATQPFYLALFSIDGKLLHQEWLQVGRKSIEWDTTALSDGLYVLTTLSQEMTKSSVRVLKHSP